MKMQRAITWARISFFIDYGYELGYRTVQKRMYRARRMAARMRYCHRGINSLLSSSSFPTARIQYTC
jgi:hypothetical protein